MIRPGPRNLITDVRGIKVGNAADAGALTGATVVLQRRFELSKAGIRCGRHPAQAQPGRRGWHVTTWSRSLSRLD